jgi:para-nitrobenzyl esterase
MHLRWKMIPSSGCSLWWMVMCCRARLIGSAAREFPLYGGADKAQRAVQVAYGTHADKVLPLYGLDKLTLPPEDPRLGDVGTQVASDVNFRCPVTVVSRLHQAAGARVWQYQLDRAAPDANGVVKHGAELPFVLDGLPLTGPIVVAAPPVEIKKPNPFNTSVREPAPAAAVAPPPPAPAQPPPAAQSMQAYWVRFAMTGDPNGPGLPRWPEYSRKREYLEFTESGALAKRDLRAAFCDLLNRP